MPLPPHRNRDAVFHRQVGQSYPVVDRGCGAYLTDTAGKEYLDAAGGIFVINVGHAVTEIAEAMAHQAKTVAFAHTGNFTSAVEIAFAEKLTNLAPEGFNHAWICTSGSQANETAIKLARTYHLLKADPARTQVISRWNSYHGSSLGALSLTGHMPRREPFTPYLFASPKIESPYCYRCPFNLTYPSCDLACANQLDTTLRRHGPRTVSAFIAEPVSGGPLGALVPPLDYLRRIREICDRHSILMIVDEVVTGAGRTGRDLAIDHFDVIPDIITMAKGIGGGYVPIGAVLVHDRIFDAFESAGAPFRHGETFTGHAVAAAAGCAVLDVIARDGLTAQAAARGERLGAGLRSLTASPIVGDVRGLGLLWGVEIVSNKATKAPFARSLGIAERIAAAAFDLGLMVVAGTGCVDGEAGDTITIAPPFIISDSDIELIVERLAAAIAQVAAQV